VRGWVYCSGMERTRCFFSILLLQTFVIVLVGSVFSENVKAETSDQSAYNSAFQLIRQRQFEDSIDAMIAFTGAFPNSELVPDAIFWVGQIEDVLGKDTQAIKTFAYLAKSLPNYRRILQVQVKLGKLLIKNGRLNEGLSVLAKAIDLAPSSVEAGIAYREIKKTGSSNAAHFLSVYDTTIAQVPAPTWIQNSSKTSDTINVQALSNTDLCRLATRAEEVQDEKPQKNWKIGYEDQKYVVEAYSRKLSCGVRVSLSWEQGQTSVSMSTADQPKLRSDSAVCLNATTLQNGKKVWEKSSQWSTWVLEAKSRGLSCGVGSSPQIAKAPIESESSIPASQSKSSIEVGEKTEIRALRERLASLEAEKNAKQQLISQDTEKPSLRITSFNSNGPSGTISGITSDNKGIAEVLVGGRPVVVDPSGQFSTSIFVPSDGIDVEVSAYDLNGLSTTEIVRLERTQRTQTVSRLAAVNPLVGLKQKPSRDRAALIIGLEKYAEAPPADYASRDAQMFADYAREKLGISPENVMVLTDTEATRSGLLKALKVWLPQAVQPDKTDLYVFYAGHGMASDDGESAYIVPYGANTFLLEDTAISRERFYEEIGAAKPRTATFFFDNCYAGTTRSEERLLAQRPLSIKVQESPVPESYLVFTAGESNQTAGVLDEVKHGRFSYFVFKGLEGEADANQDGKISAGELHKYVRESVGRFSAGAQTPTMLGDAGRWVLR
jgi:tetratricopeptide (TPR) repeat protein